MADLTVNGKSPTTVTNQLSTNTSVELLEAKLGLVQPPQAEINEAKTKVVLNEKNDLNVRMILRV